MTVLHGVPVAADKLDAFIRIVDCDVIAEAFYITLQSSRKAAVAGGAVPVAQHEISGALGVTSEFSLISGGGAFGGHGVTINVPDLSVIIEEFFESFGERRMIGAVMGLDPLHDFFGGQGAVIDWNPRLYKSRDQANPRIRSVGRQGGAVKFFRPFLIQ